ncbi:hypothetical protein D3C87_1663010 [compost metagenome]
MVDQRAVFAMDALCFERLEHRPGVFGQGFDVVHLQRFAVVGHQEKPVAAPGDITNDTAMARHVHGHLLAEAVSRDVAQRDVAVRMQRGVDRADRRIDLVLARADQPQVLQ